MTDLTIIQFMISGALLLGLISIGFLVVHLRKAIERYNIHAVEYKQNLMGHLGRLENDLSSQKQEIANTWNRVAKNKYEYTEDREKFKTGIRNIKESLKRRPTINQFENAGRNMEKTFETQECAKECRRSLVRQLEEIRADIETKASAKYIETYLNQQFHIYSRRFTDIETKSQLFDPRTREHCESTMGGIAKRLLVLEKDKS